MVEVSPINVSKSSDEMEAPNVGGHVASNEATIASDVMGGVESTCNSIGQHNKGGENSGVAMDASSLSFADQLMEQGSKAMKDNDFNEAADCFSRALEIRVGHYGELAPECVMLYYKYGCALLYKAQEETDPLGAIPKKDSESLLRSDKGSSAKNAVNGETSSASVLSSSAKNAVNGETSSASVLSSSAKNAVNGETSSTSVLSFTSTTKEEAFSIGKNQIKDAQDEDAEDGDVEESDTEDLVEADEDESDLDLAWKMLDVARAIVEKHSDDTVEKVDILSALAEVALEREDIESSCNDYHKALSILERLAEPDSRQIAELNFRICLCLEFGSKPQEAVPYCQRAISICKSRVLRLMDEVKGESPSISSASESVQSVQQSSECPIDISVSHKEAEIETLNGLLSELEKKLEDLQQAASNPKSVLSELLGIASVKAKDSEGNGSPIRMNTSQIAISTSNNGDFDSPTVSTAHTDNTSVVTHLGVVGRGVKRVLMNPEPADSGRN